MGAACSGWWQVPLPSPCKGCSAASVLLRACPGRPQVPGRALPRNEQRGPLQRIQLRFKVETFQRALPFFFFLPFLFFSLQTINYKFKRKFQPSFPPQKFRGNKYKAAQCRNKIVHPVLSEIKVVVVWGWFFYFFFGVKCIIGVQCSCLDNELSGYLWINGKPASHR